VRVPDNRASSTFSRYSPAAVTFINQIAQVIFGQQSLEDYFRDLYLAYLSGAETPSYLCTDAGCLACALRYSYNSEHGWELEPGNSAILDPDGWYISGAYAGFGNPNWVIGQDDTVGGELTAMHLKVEIPGGAANLNFNLGYLDNLGDPVVFTVSSPEVSVIDGAGGRVEIILDLMTATVYTGVFFNTNSPASPEFKVTGLQICE
jgi:hypothetical protein